MKNSYRLKTFSVIMSLVMLFMALPFEVFALKDNEPTPEVLPQEEVLVQDTSDQSEELSEPAEESDPYVLGEVEELRESNSKHFRMSDGSYTAVSYASDVHYEDDGTWKEIDNTLLPCEDGIVNTASDVQYTFSSDSDALPGVTAVWGEYQISFSGVQEETQSTVSDDQQPMPEEPINADLNTENPEPLPDGIANIEDESVITAQSIAPTENSIESVQKTVEPALPEFELEIVNPHTKVAAVAVDSQESEEEYPTVEQASALDTLTSAVKYNEVNGGDSYVYELQGRDLKESVVVSTPREDYTYRFVLNLDGLTAVLTENGDISLRDADTEIFVMPAPYMLDADGAYSDAAAYTLSELPDGTYTLTLTADAEWLNASERVFPVVIDPSIYVTNSSTTDTAITTEYMMAGDIQFPDGWFAVGRAHEIDFYSYVKVNTLPNIPYNARFCKAWLGLWYTAYWNPQTGYMESFKDFHLYAQEALGNWKSQFTGTLNENRIVDYRTIKAPPRSETVELEIVQLDVTQQAKKWYDDASSNKGITLYAKQPNGDALNNDCEAMIMFPKYQKLNDGTVATPFFEVNYRNIQGIESYYSNQSFSAGRAGTAYVSDYTGALTLVHTDVSDGYTLSHVYNSNYADHVFTSDAIFHTVDYSNMVIGKGWKLSAQESVVTQTIKSYDGVTGEYAIYTDADGTEHYFHTSATEEFKDEDGLGLVLKRNNSAHTFTMTDDKGNEKLFVYGYLTQIKDSNGNITAFLYNNAAYSEKGNAWYPKASGNRLTKIVQKNDQKTEYTVATLGYTGNRLTSVTDRYGKVMAYAVGSSNQLSTITEPDNTVLSYGYGGGNLKMSYAYDAESRTGLRFTYRENKSDMVSLTAYGVNSAGEDVINRLYYFNMTADGHSKVRDCGIDNKPYTADDVTGYYTFDNFGRTVSYAAINQYGNTLSTAGGTYQPHETGKETSKKNNRLLSEGATGAVAQNKLLGGDGESDTPWGGPSTVVGYYSQGRTTDAKKSGSSSIRVNLEQSAKSTCMSQTVNIVSEGYYNVTAYVKSSRLETTSDPYSGAYLDVTGSGVTVVRRDMLTAPTDANVNGGWRKLTTVVLITEKGNHTCQLKLNKCIGTVYFDEINLTDGQDDSAFNFIENGNFDHGLYGASNTVEASAKNIMNYNGAYSDAVRLEGKPQSQSLYSKNVPITLTAAEAQNTTFLLSGWAYARSLPMSQDDRTFQLTAEIHYAGGENQYVTAHFNPDIAGDWQYVCTPVVPNKNKAITGITVHCSFKQNSGFAYFDDIALTADPCATYRYNDDGKLIASNSTNRDELQYQYSGADLISSSGGASGDYTYTYDNAHNIIKASNEGLSQSMTYDAAGLVTSTTLKGDGSTTYLKSTATYTADGTKVSSTTDTLGNTTSYQYSDDGEHTSVTSPVSNTEGTAAAAPHNGHFTSYPSAETYRQTGWEIYTAWDDSYFYVRFEADQLKSDQTRYLDWYFDNNGIHYRIYARWNEQTDTPAELWFGRDDYGQTSYNSNAVRCRIDTTEGYAEFRVHRTAGEGIDKQNRLFLNRAYVWSGSWQMLDYASINRTALVSSYATVANTDPAGKITTHTVTDDAGRTTQTYVNGIASVDYDYSKGRLDSITRGGYGYNGGVQGAFTTYGAQSLVYAANGWKVYIQGGQDDCTYVRFENPNLRADETRYLDWYFDNDGVEYRMYARWEKETLSTYDLWFGRDKTGEPFDYKSTEYAVDVKHGFAEFRLDYKIGGIWTTPDKVHHYGRLTLNRAYVWSGSWQMLDSQVFDKYVSFDYNNSDAAGKQTQEYSFAYDLFGNCLETRVGNRTLITNTYDRYTNLTSSEYGNDYTVNYTYDALERITSKEDDYWVERYAYDKNGKISWLQATSKDDPATVRTTTYEYDTLGRLIYSVETDQDGQTLRYVKNQYNSKNQLTAYTLYDGRETKSQQYTYKADGSIDTLWCTNGDLITNTYDSLKRISQKTIDHDSNADNRITVSTAYVDGKNANQTTTLIDSVRYGYQNADKAAGGTVYDYKYMYKYDNVGNITRAYYRTAGTDGKYVDHEVGRYAYDKQNQLVMEQVYGSRLVGEDGDPYPDGYTLIYTYDTYGNIREVRKYQGVGYASVGEAVGFGTLLNVESYGYTDGDWKDLLTSYNGRTFEYDAIGNPTYYYNGKTYTMGWAGRRLTGATVVYGASCDYGYDSDGQRISKKVGNAEYTYLYYGTKLMQYGKKGDYDLYFFYDDNDQPLGFYFKGVLTGGVAHKYYFVLNAQGDVVQIRDSANKAVANYHYDAWGKLLSITNTNGIEQTFTSDFFNPGNASIAYINPIRYRGYVYDNETGFYYLNTRYYDPSLRRFISADGIIDNSALVSQNQYTYVYNNPVRGSDHDGMLSDDRLLELARIYNSGGYVGLCGGRKSTPTAASDSWTVPPLKPLDNPQPLAPIPEPLYPITAEEKETQLTVAQTIYGEAGKAEEYSVDWVAGQEAVAWVIINRMQSISYPNDAISVVTAPNQFAGYSNGLDDYTSGNLHPETWNNAFKLGGYVAIGHYELIPYPESWGNTKCTGFYSGKGNPNSIGGNVFK